MWKGLEMRRKSVKPRYTCGAFSAPIVHPLLLSLVLALTLTFVAPAASKLVILLPNNMTKECKTALSSAWPYPLAPQDLVGAAENLPLSPGRSGDNVSGAIVLVENWKAIYLSDTALRYQQRGALALVISTSYSEAGRSVWTTRYQYRADAALRGEIEIPIFQTTDAECRETINALVAHPNPSIAFHATLNNEEDYNGFAKLADSSLGIVFQVIMGVPPVIGIGLVIWRLVTIIHFEPKRTESIVILCIIFLGHGFRILFAVDPHGMRSFFSPYVILFFSSTSVSVNLICDLIILFHWNSALHSFGAKNLDWLLKYVIVFLIVTVMLEITFSSLRMFEIAPAVIFAFQVFYVVVELAVIIFVIYTANGLFKYLRKTPREKDRNRLGYRKSARFLVLKMTRLLIATSCFNLVLIFSTISISLGPFRYPVSEMIVWTIGMTATSTIGILETLVIREGRDIEKEKEKISRSRSASSLKLKSGVIVSASGSQAASQTTESYRSVNEGENENSRKDPSKEALVGHERLSSTKPKKEKESEAEEEKSVTSHKSSSRHSESDSNSESDSDSDSESDSKSETSSTSNPTSESVSDSVGDSPTGTQSSESSSSPSSSSSSSS